MKYIFRSRVAKVEENFEKIYKAESVGEAKVESQVEFDLKSRGWFVTLDGWGVSVRLSDDKPDIAAGDVLTLTLEKTG